MRGKHKQRFWFINIHNKFSKIFEKFFVWSIRATDRIEGKWRLKMSGIEQERRYKKL